MDEDEVEKVLIMTVGLPRSGKSTWARETGHPIVSPDAVRLALHGKFYISSAEPVVWAIARIMVLALFEAGHDKVVFDACNNTKKRRDEWLSRKWKRSFVIFDAPASLCVARAVEADNRPDLVPIIERMAEQHEPVTDEERVELQ